MIKRPVRDETYSLKDYLSYIHDGDICENADVQRAAGNFDDKEVNEIVYTVLTLDHIPELILAECNEDGHTYIVDGLQRTTMLKKFIYGNYKITNAIDDPIVEYTRKKRDETGKVIKNDKGQIEFEDTEIDIRKKTYETLPEELKKVFNKYQIRVVIHEDCTKKRISKLIKRYNYQKPMTSTQRAFTYIDNYAVNARNVLDKRFFIECAGYTEKEKINGTIERVITESVMCMFHLDNWKRGSKSVCEYLNENSSDEEFSMFEDMIERLGNIITPDFNNIFVSKNSFIWFKVFHDFTKLGLEDKLFSDFVHDFNSGLKDKIVENIEYKKMKEVTYSKLDKEAGTKDRVLVLAKIKAIETLMKDYFNIEEVQNNDSVSNDEAEADSENFIADLLGMDIKIVEEEMEVYNDTLNDLISRTIKDGSKESKLFEPENRISLLAMVAYSYKDDVDLDEWLTHYAKNNNTYLNNQRENYLSMLTDFKDFANKNRKSA